jgi:hypothetical protein
MLWPRVVSVVVLLVLGAGMVSGLVSIVVFVVDDGGLELAGLRRIIGLIGLLAAVAVAPAVFAVVVAAAGGVDPWDSRVWVLVRRRYVVLFGLVAVAAGVGAGVYWLTGLWSGWSALVVRLVALAVLGAGVLLLGVAIMMGEGGRIRLLMAARLAPVGEIAPRMRRAAAQPRTI